MVPKVTPPLEVRGNQENPDISHQLVPRHAQKPSKQANGLAYSNDGQDRNKRKRDSDATNPGGTKVSQTSTQLESKRMKSQKQLWSPLELNGFGIGKGRAAFADTLASPSRETDCLSLLMFREDIDEILEKIPKLQQGETTDVSRLKTRTELICEGLRENASGADSQSLQIYLQILSTVQNDQLQRDFIKSFQLLLALFAIDGFLRKYDQTNNYQSVDWKKKTPMDPCWVTELAAETNKQATEGYKMLDDVRDAYFIESASIKIHAALDLAKKDLLCTTQLMRMIWTDTEEYEDAYAATHALRVHFVQRVRFNIHLRKDRVIQRVKEGLRVIEHGLYPRYRAEPSYHVLKWATILKSLKESINMDLEKTYVDEATAKQRTRLWEEDFSAVQWPAPAVLLQATSDVAQTDANALA